MMARCRGTGEGEQLQGRGEAWRAPIMCLHRCPRKPGHTVASSDGIETTRTAREAPRGMELGVFVSRSSESPE